MDQDEKSSSLTAQRAGRLNLHARAVPFRGTGLARRSFIGIDLGASHVKAVACAYSKKALTITGWGIWPVEPTLGTVPNRGLHETLSTEVQSWLRSFGKRRRTSVTGLYGDTIKSLAVSFPNLSAKEFLAAATLEAKSRLNFKDNEALVHVIPYDKVDGDDSNTHGLVLIADKGGLARTRDLLASLHLPHGAFQSVPLAECRMAGLPFGPLGEGDQGESAEDTTQALIDLGAAQVRVAMFQGREVLYVREFPVPKEAFDSSPYGVALETPWPDGPKGRPLRIVAEPTVVEPAFLDVDYIVTSRHNGWEVPSDDPVTMDPMQLLSLVAIADEIKMTLQHFLASSAGVLHRIWLIGGGACQPEVVKYLADHLEMPVEVAPLPVSLQLAMSENEAKSFERSLPLLYPALSLAHAGALEVTEGRFASGFGSEILTRNPWLRYVMPTESFSTIEGKSQRAAFLTIVTVFLSALWFGVKQPAIRTLTDEINELSSQTTTLDDSLVSLRQFLLQHEKDTSGQEPEESIPNRMPYWTRLLHTLGHLNLPELRVKRVQTELLHPGAEPVSEKESPSSSSSSHATSSQGQAAPGDRIVLAGEIETSEALARLVQAIKAIPSLSNATIENVSSNENSTTGLLEFEILMRLDWD